jgi:hypothetical protein
MDGIFEKWMATITIQTQAGFDKRPGSREK